MASLLRRWINRVRCWMGGRASAPENGAGAEQASDRCQDRGGIDQPGTVEWNDASGKLIRRTVRLTDYSDTGAGVYSSKPLPAGHTVRIKTGGHSARGVVRWCEPSPPGYRSGLALFGSEKRRHQRFPFSEEGVLDWTSEAGKACRQKAVVQNWSETGMQFAVEEQVDVPVLVRWRGQDIEAQGMTCYCRPNAGRFYVGVQFVRPPYPREAAEAAGPGT